MNLGAPDYVVLIVDDVDRAVEFYTRILGLKPGHRSGEYAQLDTGPTRLALYSRAAMEQTLGMALQSPLSNAPGFEIGFKVADVDQASNEVTAAGAQAAMPPTDRFWGQRTAYVR